MLKEALAFFESLVSRSLTARIINVPGIPRKVLLDQGGKVEELEIPAPLRIHTIERIEDLCEFATKLAKASGKRLSAWHGQDSIVVLLDDDDRRERLTMPLKYTSAFELVSGLEDSAPLTQIDLLVLLRVGLDGAFQNPGVIGTLRNIRFKKSSDSHVEVQHSRESLGRDIQQEAIGLGEIPDEITISTSVYANPPLDEDESEIRLALDIDIGKEKFFLRPFPDEVLRASQYAHDRIAERLAALLPTGTPIACGTP